MLRGFFPASTFKEMKAPTSLVAKCGACGLFQSCKSPKLKPTGKGRRKILLVSEAPNAEEDRQGVHLTGDSSTYLADTLRTMGIDVRRDCLTTSALICKTTGDSIPTGLQVGYCRPNLVKVIDEFQPTVIVPMGSAAVKSVLTGVYKDNDIGTIARWAGWKIPCQKLNAWICPITHPRQTLADSLKNPVPKLLFEQHLKQIAEIESAPWKKVPQYGKQVERIMDPRAAEKAIDSITAAGIVAAFDYETTCLKPEYDGAAIVCCSISNGDRTIAYPWLGEAIEATKRFLRSPLPKIASNLKFEERWSLWEFGRGVRNWAWDTMVNAHCIDNRPDITSVKFQAFVLLGVEAYDEHIKPFLRVKNGRINQVRDEVGMEQLLLYCGLDSLLEFKVAQIQARLVGVDLGA